MPTHVLAFTTTVALLAMLPGVNNAAITRQTLTYGRRAGWQTVAGSSTAIVIWSIAAALDLSAAVLANPNAFLTIRIAGAAVLAFLGAQTLWSLRRPPRPAAASPATRRSAMRIAGAAVLAFLGAQPLWPGAARPARRGVSSHPTQLRHRPGNRSRQSQGRSLRRSLPPQFVTAHGPVLASSIALGFVWALVSGTWFLGYVQVLNKGRARVNKPTFRRGMEAATGVTLLGLGVAVALGA